MQTMGPKLPTQATRLHATVPYMTPTDEAGQVNNDLPLASDPPRSNSRQRLDKGSCRSLSVTSSRVEPDTIDFVDGEHYIRAAGERATMRMQNWQNSNASAGVMYGFGCCPWRRHRTTSGRCRRSNDLRRVRYRTETRLVFRIPCATQGDMHVLRLGHIRPHPSDAFNFCGTPGKLRPMYP